jgi:hypothetical protein
MNRLSAGAAGMYHATHLHRHSGNNGGKRKRGQTNMTQWRLALCAGVAILLLSNVPISAQQQNVGGGFQFRHSFGASGAGSTVRPWVQGSDNPGSGYSGSPNATGGGLSGALGQDNGLSFQGSGNIPGGKAIGKK